MIAVLVPVELLDVGDLGIAFQGARATVEGDHVEVPVFLAEHDEREDQGEGDNLHAAFSGVPVSDRVGHCLNVRIEILPNPPPGRKED